MPAAAGTMKREQEERAKRMRQGRREAQERVERRIRAYWQEIDEEIEREDGEPARQAESVEARLKRLESGPQTIEQIRAGYPPKGWALRQGDKRCRRAGQDMAELQIAEYRWMNGDLREKVAA